MNKIRFALTGTSARGIYAFVEPILHDYSELHKIVPKRG